MNGFVVPPEIQEQQLLSRGRAHPFAALDPARTALVVIDMQVGYMDDRLGMVNLAAAHSLVPHINRLAAGVRDAGGKVFWIQHTVPAEDDDWTVMIELESRETRERRLKALSVGTPGHAIHPSMDVREEDRCCQKRRFSAFFPGSSDLPDILRAEGLDTVLITGIAANICCESSARDAIMANFRTVMISDANATYSEEATQAALLSFYRGIGDVFDIDTALAALGNFRSG